MIPLSLSICNRILGDRNLYGQKKFSPRKHMQSLWFHRESDSIHDGEYRRHGNATQNCNFTKLFGLDQPALVPTTVERSGPTCGLDHPGVVQTTQGGLDHSTVVQTTGWSRPRSGGADRRVVQTALGCGNTGTWSRPKSAW